MQPQATWVFLIMFIKHAIHYDSEMSQCQFMFLYNPKIFDLEKSISPWLSTLSCLKGSIYSSSEIHHKFHRCWISATSRSLYHTEHNLPNSSSCRQESKLENLSKFKRGGLQRCLSMWEKFFSSLRNNRQKFSPLYYIKGNSRKQHEPKAEKSGFYYFF